ncbi:Wzt carbohydrate-binding domain-containing protein, partial [Mesorhizobium sp. M1C.F.Ca.ET.187.01.1.1]
RKSLISASPLRNDLEVMRFSPDAASFGQGGVEITQVVLEDRDRNPLSWVVGGEAVSLVVQAHATVDVHQPIIGFFLKDKHGQTLFGDNTYLTYLDAPPMVSAGER